MGRNQGEWLLCLYYHSQSQPQVLHLKDYDGIPSPTYIFGLTPRARCATSGAEPTTQKPATCRSVTFALLLVLATPLTLLSFTPPTHCTRRCCTYRTTTCGRDPSRPCAPWPTWPQSTSQTTHCWPGRGTHTHTDTDTCLATCQDTGTGTHTGTCRSSRRGELLGSRSSSSSSSRREQGAAGLQRAAARGAKHRPAGQEGRARPLLLVASPACLLASGRCTRPTQASMLGHRRWLAA